MKPSLHFGATRVPTTVAAFQRADGSVVLVDAGYSRSELRHPFRHFGLSGALVPRTTAVSSVADQLEVHGIAASAVTTIVATHLHLDHIGGYVDFPNAEVLAPAAEFAFARRRGTLHGYWHVEDLLRSGRARPLIWRGCALEGFPAHIDLFDDGEVVIFDAKGHTAGSVAVWLKDASTDADVLMIGDAAYSREEYRSQRKSLLGRFLTWRDEYLRATWGRIEAFERAQSQSVVIPSHDYGAWCEVCG